MEMEVVRRGGGAAKLYNLGSLQVLAECPLRQCLSHAQASGTPDSISSYQHAGQGKRDKFKCHLCCCALTPTSSKH